MNRNLAVDGHAIRICRRSGCRRKGQRPSLGRYDRSGRRMGSPRRAICSAVECVVNAGAHVDRVEPDPLVSLADIAARTGLSRAAVSQYAKGQRSADFPSPVARVTSDTSLYDWSQVATWLYRQEKLSREQAIEAAAVQAVNHAICTHESKLRDTLQKRLKSYEAELEAA